MSSRAEREEVYDLVASLEPVMMRRVGRAQRLSPETLPDELLLLESVVVLGKELRGAQQWLSPQVVKIQCKPFLRGPHPLVQGDDPMV
jgi:hypothetical protein